MLAQAIKEALKKLEEKEPEEVEEVEEENGDDVKMSLRDYLKEHNSLINKLSGSEDPSLEAEGEKQREEVEDELDKKGKKGKMSKALLEASED